MAVRVPLPANPDCLSDPLSIVGLRKLQADRSDWAVVLAQHLPDPPALAADPTVHAALAAGVTQLDALQRLGAPAVRRHRQSCHRAADIAADLKLSEITDASLQLVREGLQDQGIASDSITRSLTILRTLARAWAAESGCLPRVTSRPTKSHSSASKPTSRPLWTPEQVAELLAATRDRAVRVAVALAVGCGLQPGEVRHVLHADVDPQQHRLLVHGASRTSAPRVMPLANWVVDLIRDDMRHRQRSGCPPSPWLLPASRDARKPRADFTQALQVAQTRAKLQHLPPVSLRTLRRTFQWFAVHAGLPREAVRGTWTLGSDGAAPPWWPRLQRLLRRDWRTLCGLDQERWPWSGGEMVMTADGLLPEDIAGARRKIPQEPPPLPASVVGSG